MIHSLEIHGYRGFDRFEMNGLGRINLLVGRNNSGKTSVLEALHLLVSAADPNGLLQVLWRRGERLLEERNPRDPRAEMDICHLFYGHEVHVGSKFSCAVRNVSTQRSISFQIAELTVKERQELFGPEDAALVTPRLAIQVKGSPQPIVPTIPLTARGGISYDALEGPHRIRRRTVETRQTQTHYISVESLSADQLVPIWETIALTPLENKVLEALRYLDPKIERLASQSTSPFYNMSRGGFSRLRKNSKNTRLVSNVGISQPITACDCLGWKGPQKAFSAPC
jgi:energy-coupling factor transporter ATP-binding protein EcfA2